MAAALGGYAARAGEKLRREGLMAGGMCVFMQTNRFNTDPPYANARSFAIEPSADSRDLVAQAVKAGRGMWRDGFRYAKAGVMLLDLSPAWAVPTNLFSSRDPKRSAALMRTLDGLNARYGRGTLRIGSVAGDPAWGTRRQRLSPRHTTEVDEMLRAYA